MAPLAPTNPITGGFWIYDPLKGEIKHVNAAQWFGFYSLRVNGLWLPFTSKKEAEDYKKKHPPKNPGILGPGLSPGDAPGNIPGVPDSLKLTDLAGFVTALTQKNTWLRVGEAVLGLILVAIGVAAVTKGTPIGSAIRATPVGRVAKLAK